MKRKIRRWLLFFITGLVLSGVTAFPIESELAVAVSHPGLFSPRLYHWVQVIFSAVHTTNTNYPYLSYGTDWLAFAHIVIATAFIGPLRDPVRNIWVIEFGIIACFLIIPLAFIAGPIRHIPLFWCLVDCSFALAAIPLYICYRYIRKLERIQPINNLTKPNNFLS